MNFWKNLILCSTTLAITLQIPAYAADEKHWVPIQGASFTVDSFQGIDAVYTAEDNAPDDPVYSCAAYVKKYYQEIYGLTVYNLIDDGPPLVDGSKVSLVPTDSPQPGDILFSPTSIGGNNHSAIVKKVDGNSLVLIEQNYKWGENAVLNREITLPSEEYQVWTLSTRPKKTETTKPSVKEEVKKPEPTEIKKTDEAIGTPSDAIVKESPAKPANLDSSNLGDITPAHWAYNSVIWCVDRKVITGYEDGSFHPDQYINRAELASLIAKTDGADLSGAFPSTFSDVSKGMWYQSAVEYARKYFPESQTGALFHPDQYALREDLAYAMVKMHGLDQDESAPIGILDAYTDGNKISSSKADAVSIAVSKGLISGFEDNTLRPKQPLTRAQAAVILKHANDL